MRKNIIFLLTLLCLLVIPAVSATNSYVVLTPGSDSTYYYSPSFENTAISINNSASLENNSVVVYFNDTNILDVNATIASHNPDYLFLVIQPSNATPQLLDDVGDMLKTLDSDPFIDVAWGVITGKDNTSAYDLYGRSIGWTDKQYAVSNAYQSCAANGDNIYSRFSASLKENYNYLMAGNEPIATKIKSAFDSLQSVFYFCTSIVDYNIYSMYNSSNCFNSDDNATSVICDSTSIADAPNTLFLSDTSESGRVSGTVASSWMRGNNTNADNSVSFPMSIISNEHAGAIVAPYSTRWPTAEFITKNIFAHVTSGLTLGNSIKVAKNTLLLNLEKEAIENKSFVEHIEKEYILYGRPTQTGTIYDNPYSSAVTNEVLIGSIHTIGEILSWNATFGITPNVAKYNQIYTTNSWNNVSLGGVWYKNITSMDINNTVNITFIAAATGYVGVHDSLINLNILDVTNEENITKMLISVDNITTAYLSNTTELMNTTIVMKDNTTVYFAFLYSPNGSITSGVRNINVTYNTTGISKNITNTSYSLSNATIFMDFVNPTAWTVTNVTVEQILPRNITTGCVISGINCSVVYNGTDTKAIFNISTLLVGTTNHNILYSTTLDANDSVTSPNGTIHDRGDTLVYSANISSVNETFADIEVTLLDSNNTVVWVKNDTLNVSINSSVYNYSTNWVIANNATVGTYSIDLIVKENSSGTTIYSKQITFDVTDKLNFYNGSIKDAVSILWDQNPNSVKWYFTTNDTLNISGTVKDQNNFTLGGISVNANLTNGGTFNTVTTNGSGVYEIGFSWFSETPGTKILTIRANDTYNNTATYTQEIYISNYANKTTLVLDRADSVYEYGKEDANLTVIVLSESGDPVHLANVTISGSGITTAMKKTDLNGVVLFTISIPEDNDNTISVSAVSPLNTTKTITNSTSYQATWLYYYNVTVTPSIPKVGQDVVVRGELKVKGTNSCNTSSISILMKKGSYNKTISDSSLDDNKFSITFPYESATKDGVLFETGKWYLTYDGSMGSCTVYGRSFGNITFDVQPSTAKSVTVTTNTTTTSSDSSTSSSDTTSSDNSDTCDDNSDCSSGDYCSSSNVCKPVSCDDGIILNHECISAYKISLSEYPKTISIEQGKSDSFDLNIKNTGYKNLTELVASFVIPSTSNFTNWYTLENITTTLEPDMDTQVEATITVPENASIQLYPFTIKIVSAEKTHEETMNIQVLPGDKEKIIINKSLENLSIEINTLKEDIAILMIKLNNSNSSIAKSKLTNIENLHEQALAAISTGDYLTAYNREKEIKSLLTQVKSLVSDSQTIVAATKNKTNIIASVILAVVVIGAIFYYLWVPAPGYESEKTKDSGYNPSVNLSKKEEEGSYFVKLKNRLNELISEYKKQKEKDANAPEKYDFHKKKRWS